MPYNPQEDAIVISKPLGALGFNIDARSTYYDEVNILRRPFISIAEVLSEFDTPFKRDGNFTILVNSTGTLQPDGSILGGSVKKYWWRDNLTDAGLVEDKSENAVNSVNSKTGTVVLNKTDVGLGNVDNTSDANKPISNATQTALNTKLSNITGLVTQGSNVTISGAGTNVSPYVVNAPNAVPNSLSIGTVVQGTTPNASITGTPPNQILNLTLPKGDKGDTGADGEIIGLQGTITPSTPSFTPSEPSAYLGETGIYPNQGGVEITGGAGYIVWNGTNWSAVNIDSDLSNYVNNDNMREYLDLDFSHLGGIVDIPDDRAATTFTATPLNPSVSYFEPQLFFGGNISVNKIYVKSPVVGQAFICFIQIIGSDVQVLYAEQKSIVVGINSFDLSDFTVPQSVLDLPKVYIGLSERGSPVGTASILANPDGTLLAALNSGLHPLITNPGNILNLWAELNTTDFLIGGYKKIDYLSTYQPNDIYNTINPKDGINDFVGGVSDTSYFGDGLQVLTPKQKLVNFHFKSTTAGTVQILFVSYPSCVVVHTATMSVASNTTYSWSPSDLGLPDLSAYSEVYTFLHNTDPNPTTATVKLSSSGINVFLSTFVPSSPAIQFDKNSIYRVAYWMDVINDNPNIVDQLQDLQSKVSSSEVATYDELLLALNSQKIITLKDGVIEVEDTIDVPYGTTIQGSKKAILKAGSGVDVVIRLGAEDTCLSGFTLIGNGADVDITSTAKVNLPINIEQYPTNLGTGIGILCYKGSGDIKNLRIKNFDRSGIEIQNTFINVGEFPKGFNVEGIICQNNYFGIRTTPYGEYSRISNVNCMKNVCGISVVSGNIAVSNSHFTQNRIGTHIGAKYETISADETNNAHGGFTNCFFNHNELRGLYVVNITNAQLFTGCNYFDGIIEFNNSTGATITGGLIASEITVTSNANQLSMITNSVFRSDGGDGAGIINKTGAGRLSMFGNRYSTGKDDTLLNQEL